MFTLNVLNFSLTRYTLAIWMINMTHEYAIYKKLRSSVKKYIDKK